jgi:hypothetical protein
VVTLKLLLKPLLPQTLLQLPLLLPHLPHPPLNLLQRSNLHQERPAMTSDDAWRVFHL